MRTNLAVLIFSFKKKEACFLNSWNKGLPMFALLLLKIDIALGIEEDEGLENFQIRLWKMESVPNAKSKSTTNPVTST